VESKGTIRLNITLPREVHEDLRMLSAATGKSMNDFVLEAVRGMLQTQSRELVDHVEGWLSARRGRGLWQGEPESD
jgi:hypothetical protein